MPTSQWSSMSQIYDRKKVEKPCDKRTIVNDLRKERAKDIGKACRVLNISRSSLHYQSVKNYETLIKLLQHLSETIEGENY